jgi:Kef-type K+ transport system membrane component KefB
VLCPEESVLSSSVLVELRWLNNPETPAVLSILVLKDLAMAPYLLSLRSQPGRLKAVSR